MSHEPTEEALKNLVKYKIATISNNRYVRKYRNEMKELIRRYLV